jgi:molybdenum cofactor cytidylyltransferase
MLAAAILAAGESTRMGEPKALVSVQGLTFVEHLFTATRLPRVGLTRIVLGAHAAEIGPKLKFDPAMVVFNPDWTTGQLSSIHAAIRSLPIEAGRDYSAQQTILVSSSLVELVANSPARSRRAPYAAKGASSLFFERLYDELLAASERLARAGGLGSSGKSRSADRRWRFESQRSGSFEEVQCGLT